ncbi:MAG: glycogen/starch synthase [Paludibacteraceae bacterium]|nr:glycogen/starch synthase [Paludibacteraceae bacterium]
MKEPLRILFICQEIFPYLAEETPIRKLNRMLPEVCQANGFETRTFMPKFGEINERRNQLHEVIRLSGMNIIIDDTDHPLLLKVASIQAARIQIYFIDNDDYFRRRRGLMDEKGKEYHDNDERTIFFARSVIETVKKLRWTPDIIYCSGWMSALAPLYLKKAYADTPFFADSKIVFSIDDDSFRTPFGLTFADKVMMDGISKEDIEPIVGRKAGYNELMKLGVDYSDAVVLSAPSVNSVVKKHAGKRGIPMMPYKGDNAEDYLNFFHQLLGE